MKPNTFGTDNRPAKERKLHRIDTVELRKTLRKAGFKNPYSLHRKSELGSNTCRSIYRKDSVSISVGSLKKIQKALAEGPLPRITPRGNRFEDVIANL